MMTASAAAYRVTCALTRVIIFVKVVKKPILWWLFIEKIKNMFVLTLAYILLFQSTQI